MSEYADATHEDAVDRAVSEREQRLRVGAKVLRRTRAYGKLILLGEHFVVYPTTPALVGAVAAYTDCEATVTPVRAEEDDKDSDDNDDTKTTKAGLTVIDHRPAVPHYKVQKAAEGERAIKLVLDHLNVDYQTQHHVRLQFGGDLCCASGIGASAAQVVSLARALPYEVPLPRLKDDEIAEKDRTCPSCNRVFTSVHGLNYHLERKVCKVGKNVSAVALPTLEPGQKFVTTYGVVEVVKDDRAKPTALLPADLKQKVRRFDNASRKRNAKIRKEINNIAVETRIRRKMLQQAYLDGNLNSKTVAKAYNNHVVLHPELRSDVDAAKPAALDDPSTPEGSFPERIVECVLRPDRRVRVIGVDEDAPLEGLAEDEEGAPVVKMFLPRRLLTNAYTEDTVRYYCPTCWNSFLSKPGLTYHVSQQSCTKRAARDLEAQKAQQNSIENRATEFLENRKLRKSLQSSVSSRATVPSSAVVDSQPEPGFRGRDGRFRGPRIPKAENKDDTGQSDDSAAAPVKKKAKKKKKKYKNPIQVDIGDDLVNPNDTIDELTAEFHRLQGQMIGPMYPEVWSALGYQKPRKKPKKRRKRGDAATKRKKIKKEEPPAAPPSPAEPQIDALKGRLSLPPREPVSIIDTRVMATEVDAGRYPSIKRYHGAHDGVCAICKCTNAPYSIPDVPNRTVECDFCRNIVHLSCMKTKYEVKDPEPDDDFMCYKCINIVTARRTRAEKRRLEKLMPDEEDVIKAEEMRARDQRELLDGVVDGREFECVAAQARHIEDATELLRDAKARLALNIEVASMNRARRSLLDT